MSEEPTEIRAISDEARQAMRKLGYATAELLQHALVADPGDEELAAAYADCIRAYQAEKARFVVEVALPDHAMTIYCDWPEASAKRIRLKYLVPGRLHHNA